MFVRLAAPTLKLKLFIYSVQTESRGGDNVPWWGKSRRSRVLNGLRSARRFVRWIGAAGQTLKCLPRLLLPPRPVQPPGTRATTQVSPWQEPSHLARQQRAKSIEDTLRMSLIFTGSVAELLALHVSNCSSRLKQPKYFRSGVFIIWSSLASHPSPLWKICGIWYTF